MERLQWGFPIATALSSNTLTSINRKKKKKAEALATEGHGKTRKENQAWIPVYTRMTMASGEGCPRASEAKCPLPSGKRVGSREKKREKRKKREKKEEKKSKSSLKPICTQHTRGYYP